MIRSSRPPHASLTVLLLATLLLAACAGTQFEAVSDYDQNYDFAAVKTVSLLPVDRTSPAERLISDMQVRRIEAALATELGNRGYTVVEDRDAADVFLSWHLVTRERTDTRAYDASGVYNCWRCGPPASDVSVRQYTAGLFIVDLIDPARNRSVWRSTIQSRLHARSDPQRAEKNRAEVARAIFAPFPPSA